VELVAEDPEAVSALGVARSGLRAGQALEGLRRMRLLELSGPLPARSSIEDLLHRSIQFYNPQKERCTVRLKEDEPVSRAPAEALVLVWESGGERRPAAERWWQHETGKRIEVREGVVWGLRFGAGARIESAARELALLRDRRHGLLCNPHSQESRIAAGEVPVPWIASPVAGAGSGPPGGAA
jgi:hypothetical protein